jgi:hypothetical protein
VLLLVWSARVQQPAISYSVAVMVSVLAVPTIYPHSLTLAILPLLLLALSSRSGVAPSVAYGALLVGGQAAIIGLQVAALRALALVGTVAPLAALIRNYRIERKDAG